MKGAGGGGGLRSGRAYVRSRRKQAPSLRPSLRFSHAARGRGVGRSGRFRSAGGLRPSAATPPPYSVLRYLRRQVLRPLRPPSSGSLRSHASGGPPLPPALQYFFFADPAGLRLANVPPASAPAARCRSHASAAIPMPPPRRAPTEPHPPTGSNSPLLARNPAPGGFRSLPRRFSRQRVRPPLHVAGPWFGTAPVTPRQHDTPGRHTSAAPHKRARLLSPVRPHRAA